MQGICFKQAVKMFPKATLITPQFRPNTAGTRTLTKITVGGCSFFIEDKEVTPAKLATKAFKKALGELVCKVSNHNENVVFLNVPEGTDTAATFF